jgi:hypothetical protein
MKRRNAAEPGSGLWRDRDHPLAGDAGDHALHHPARWGLAFHQAQLAFPMELSAEVLDPKGNRDRAEMAKVTTVGYQKVLARPLPPNLTAGASPRTGFPPRTSPS